MTLKEAIDFANKHQSIKNSYVDTKLGQRKVQDIFISPKNDEAFGSIVKSVLLKENYNHILSQFNNDDTFQVYVLYYNQNFDPLTFFELLDIVIKRIESNE